ncbi:hypothetical protein CgunFtcFv8_017772 [Champsocephalus gunnari]|uniref:Uncharacterized protein n=1 Tax=Champsocephalus gunnari TaxID=52237 RepID=A0AAN8DMY8_CHAGU|nr:hypothetical protein CgunFtcFv8_017772 [Champsocephalus gunnari]
MGVCACVASDTLIDEATGANFFPVGPPPPLSLLALSGQGLPQVDEALNMTAGEIGGPRRAQSANWSGLVWRWSGCLAWLGLAGLGIRRSAPPASRRAPSICSVVNVHASLRELSHIQPQFLFKEHFH